MPDGRSALARIAFGLAALALAAVVAGPVLIHAGVAAPLTGFRIFSYGLLASLPALVLSLAAIARTRGPGRQPGRRRALQAALVSGSLAALLAALAVPARHVPAIHDVTTDPDDPPGFSQTARDAGAAAASAYPPENAALQRAAYPDLATLPVSSPPAQTFAAAERAATSLGWKVVRSDPAAGTLEATATSRVFRFVDDVAIRIRPVGGGSRIDLRSCSRVGKSDVGANAARIRAFAERLRGGT